MVTVICEAGVNHNGDIAMALDLVDAAADAGADMVKFQTFNAAALASKSAKKAEYQKETTGNDQSQYEMLKALELSEDDHHRLIARCRERNIAFLSTPFDFASLDLLITLDVPVLKIGSGDMSNAPLVHAIARTGKPMILSTGMANLDQVEEALGVVAHGYLGTDNPGAEAFRMAYASEAGQQVLRDNVTVLHCTTAYPTPLQDINLKAMDIMRERLQLPIGFSDHSDGIMVSIGAAARGAVVIEKHMTLDRSLPGPDHRASLEPDAFGDMVQGIRIVSEALGTGEKEASTSERANMGVARKSLFAARDIAEGEAFSPDNLTTKRPGGGIAPIRYWDMLGTCADRDYKSDEQIQESA